MRKYPQTLTFLIAYLIYNDAIQTVITMSAQFGADELNITYDKLDACDSDGADRRFPRSHAFNWIAKSDQGEMGRRREPRNLDLDRIAMYGFVKTDAEFLSLRQSLPSCWVAARH